MLKPIRIEVSPGEVVDRVGILALKIRHAPSDPVRARLEAERARLSAALSGGIEAWAPIADIAPRLDEVNAKLWAVEDRLRALEQLGLFDEDFVEAARSVYRLNDERAALKRAIDEALGATLRDEKIYSEPPKTA